MRKIVEAIRNSDKGVISYHTYINYALYDEDYGYYSKASNKIGKTGDYYTSSVMTPIFAEIIAEYFIKMTNEYNLPVHFYEVGSGTGDFAYFFLEQIKKLSAKLLDKIHYFSVEKSNYHRQLQKEKLGNFPVFFYEDISELPQINGVVFSNEWLDALPVHVVQQVNGELKEVVIGEKNGSLYERLMKLSNEDIITYRNEYFSSNIPNNHRLEIPLSMVSNLRELYQKIIRGIVITIDYGWTNAQLIHPSRHTGTLRGFYKHQLLNNILTRTGEMDITHDIHIDTIQTLGEAFQFTTRRVYKQYDFLYELGLLSKLTNHENSDPFSIVSKRNRAIRSLIMDDSISSAFFVLIQEKL
ncbi:SAM-dependent methyltransferase [Bacillus kwashiorkori]|uniref:SAM-dependent methyltransferase n=1 Tax=Bacillus kwashiorkori TaxID=1522318 RepID=UPI00078412A9|nr:SAM-dependent methyltransferase [Bacillus kwashiorkori]